MRGYDNELDARESTITYRQAVAAVRDHQLPVGQFLWDMGNRHHYSGAAVLDWLGY